MHTARRAKAREEAAAAAAVASKNLEQQQQQLQRSSRKPKAALSRKQKRSGLAKGNNCAPLTASEVKESVRERGFRFDDVDSLDGMDLVSTYPLSRADDSADLGSTFPISRHGVDDVIISINGFVT